MKVIKAPNSLNKLDKSKKIVFLAGSIDMNSAVD